MMNVRLRVAALVTVPFLALVSSGSRVVPLSANGGIGPNGQPQANPTGGTAIPTIGSTAGPGGTTGGGTTGAGGTGPGSLANCHAPAQPTDKGVTQTTIKVGLIAAIGGSFRGQFTPNIEAVDAYLKMINAEE